MSERELAFEAFATTLGPLTELQHDDYQAVWNAAWNAKEGS